MRHASDPAYSPLGEWIVGSVSRRQGFSQSVSARTPQLAQVAGLVRPNRPVPFFEGQSLPQPYGTLLLLPALAFAKPELSKVNLGNH
jgi:hypothetical protein